MNKPKYLYHGTHLKATKNIIKTGYFRYGKFTYFTDSLTLAEYYAFSASTDMHEIATIIKIRTPENTEYTTNLNNIINTVLATEYLFTNPLPVPRNIEIYIKQSEYSLYNQTKKGILIPLSEFQKTVTLIPK